MDPVTTAFTTFEESVPTALDALDAGAVLARQSAILIKPNLINASPPPITTPVACVEAVINYVREHSAAAIVVGEGCGDAQLETDDVFQRLGYTEMAGRLNVELVDLNRAETRLSRADCAVWPELHLPEICLTHFVISVPVLKAHSLADITGTLKNMMGVLPPEHYAGGYGSWKKAMFHGQMHASIVDLSRHRAPDLTVLDASVGMADFHLGGPHCNPPVNKIVAGADPLAVDRLAAELLGFDWQSIDHLRHDIDLNSGMACGS